MGNAIRECLLSIKETGWDHLSGQMEESISGNEKEESSMELGHISIRKGSRKRENGPMERELDGLKNNSACKIIQMMLFLYHIKSNATTCLRQRSYQKKKYLGLRNPIV